MTLALRPLVEGERLRRVGPGEYETADGRYEVSKTEDGEWKVWQVAGLDRTWCDTVAKLKDARGVVADCRRRDELGESLVELFDPKPGALSWLDPDEVKWFRRHYGHRDVDQVAEFDVGRTGFVAMFSHKLSPKAGLWYMVVDFGRLETMDGETSLRYDITGAMRGKASQVFGIVGQAIREAIGMTFRKIQAVVIRADEAEQSRVDLYRKLSKLLARRLGWDGATTVDTRDGFDTNLIYKTEEVGDILYRLATKPGSTMLAASRTPRGEVLGEGSFTEKDIPKFFYLQTRLRPEFAKELAARTLIGVSGIGGNGEIEYEYFGGGRKDVSLVMPGPATVKLNKLSRVMYWNPHYMLSKNMAAFQRVWNTDADGAVNRIGRHLDELLGDRLEWARVNSDHDERGSPAINNVRDFIKLVHFYLKRRLVPGAKGKYGYSIEFAPRAAEEARDVLTWSYAKWVRVLTSVAEMVHANYEAEAEWIVKNRRLRVPVGAKLRVAVTPHKEARHRALIEENGIDQLYDVEYVDESEWDKIKWDKFSDIVSRHATKRKAVVARGVGEGAVIEMATGDPITLPKKGAWLYHVTYFGRLEGIVKAGGLAPGHGFGGATFGTQYAAWSRGKMFVSTGDRRPHFWYSRLEDWANYNGPEFPDLTEQPDNEEEWEEYYSDHGYPPDEAEEKWREGKKDWTVVVLRYRDHGRHRWSPDYEEDHEDDEDYYWTDRSKKIPAKLISVWDPKDGGWWTRLDRSTINDLDSSIEALLTKSLRRSPDGYGYEYAPNSSKLMGDLDESASEGDYVGDPKMGKALRKVGFRTMGQAKQAARVRRGQVRLSKLPKKYRKKLLDPRRRDLLHDQQVDERSFFPADIPDEYRVVFYLGSSEKGGDALAWKSLAMGKLLGIRGISSSGAIEAQWLGVARDAVLVMPGKALARENKLTRIMYDNIHYLLSDDMRAMKRIVNATGRDQGQARAHAARVMLEYLRKLWEKEGGKAFGNISYQWRYAGLDHDYARKFAGIGKVNNVRDFINAMRRITKRDRKNNQYIDRSADEFDSGYGGAQHGLLTLTYNDWFKWLSEVAKVVQRVYSDEAEWVSKGDAIKIPAGSTLRLLTTRIPEDIWKLYQKNYPKGGEPGFLEVEYKGHGYALQSRAYKLERLRSLGLLKRYKIEWIYNDDFERERKTYWGSKQYSPPTGTPIREMEARGDCYEAAANYMMAHGTLGSALFRGGKEGDPDLILVHGEVTGQGPIAGLKYGHAWVEDGNTVIDQSNGRDLRMPKLLYYALAQIDHRPSKQNLHKYTAEEARKKMLEHGHYGPWDLKTESGL